MIVIAKNQRLTSLELLHYAYNSSSFSSNEEDSKPKNIVTIEDNTSSEDSTVTITPTNKFSDETTESEISLHRSITLLLSICLYNHSKEEEEGDIIQIISKLLTLDTILDLKDSSKWNLPFSHSLLTPDFLKTILDLSKGFLYSTYMHNILFYPSFCTACLTIEASNLVITDFIDYESYNVSNLNTTTYSRDVLYCFQILRAMLEQSRFNDSSSDKIKTPEMINIVEYYGAVRRVLITQAKILEQEMNLLFINPNMDLSNVECSIMSLNQGILILIQKTGARLNSSEQINSSADIYQSLEHYISLLQTKIQEEFKTSSKPLLDFEQAQIQKQQVKQQQSQQFQQKEKDLSGMSEAQIQKMLKKRAEKEKKAAAKKSQKKSSLGTGTSSLLTLFEHLNYNTYQNISTTFLSTLLSGGTKRKPKLPRGTRDYFPHEMALRQHVISTIRTIFLSHGGEEIDTPIFELRDTLLGKYGDEGGKLIYDLADQGGDALSLRYDLTVPFARFLAMYNIGSIKRFHIGKVYRRDQPVLSKGRYREFYQCDFDISMNTLQYSKMVPDAECICIMSSILDSVDIGEFRIKVNHRVLLDAILDLAGVAATKFKSICSSIDKLDKEPWESVALEMVNVKGLSEEQVDKIGKIVLQSNENVWELYHDLISNKVFGKHKGAASALADLKLLFEYLESMDKLRFIRFDLSLARGLDYYTGVIYEAVSISGGVQVGSIGGGGRYDNLVSMFQDANKVTPCVGVSIGIERVFTLLEERLKKKGEDYQRTIDVYIASASTSTALLKTKMEIATLLWNNWIKCDYNSFLENPKLKYELQHVLEKNIPYMIIIGEDEWKEKKVNVKDMKERKESVVEFDDLIRFLKEDCGVASVNGH